MANFDWDELEKSAGGNFAPMAPAGTYTAKVDTIETRDSKTGTHWVDFIFQDGEYRYPKISRSISFKNQGWRMVHFKRILIELGIAEDKAKLAIEQAEGKKGEANIVAAYSAMLRRAVQKNPEVSIEVFEDTVLNPNSGKPYMRADFANPRIGFGRKSKPQAAPAAQASVLDDGEQIDLSDLPF